MFQGLRTVIYHVSDIDKAKAWYQQALGIAPYFDQPFYVGFNVGGYELGLDPNPNNVTHGTNGYAYWGVDNIEQAFTTLVHAGATSHSPIQDVGEGIKVAALKDPFGNVIGIIENPHFKLP